MIELLQITQQKEKLNILKLEKVIQAQRRASLERINNLRLDRLKRRESFGLAQLDLPNQNPQQTSLSTSKA